MIRSLTLLMLIVPAICFSQTNKIRFTNQLAGTLNGAGDLLGYKIDAGIEKQIFKRTYLAVRLGVCETKGSSTVLIHSKAYENDAAISLTAAITRSFKILNKLSISPEVGFVLRSHKWTVIAGPTFRFIKGDRVIPPGTSAQWNDNTIGYHFQIPFEFQTGKRTAMIIFAEYENDTFGYTFFSVGTGIKIGLGKTE